MAGQERREDGGEKICDEVRRSCRGSRSSRDYDVHNRLGKVIALSGNLGCVRKNSR